MVGHPAELAPCRTAGLAGNLAYNLAIAAGGRRALGPKQREPPPPLAVFGQRRQRAQLEVQVPDLVKRRQQVGAPHVFRVHSHLGEGRGGGDGGTA